MIPSQKSSPTVDGVSDVGLPTRAMSFRTGLSTCLALVALGAAWAPRPAAAAEPEFTMILATVAPPDSPWSALLDAYKKAIEAKSNGRIKVKPKLGGTMGDEAESVTKCKRGQIQAVGASTGALGTVVPEVNVVEMPYLFRDGKEADRVIDGALTPELEKAFTKKGFVMGFWSENGFRHFGTKRKPLKSAADLKGQKMRAQESKVHEEMYKALGAAYQPIPTTEVPQALSSGTVDGFDQSLLYAVATAWHKSVDHISLTNHIYQPGIIVFNKEWFDKLPDDLKQIVVEEGRKLQQGGRDAVRKINPDLVSIIENDKVKVYKPTADELRALEVEARKSYAATKKHYGAEFTRILGIAESKIAEARAGK
jgi:tripartite ATP-independent transporter DctP family solute receptor